MGKSDKRALVQELREKGYSYREIERETGIPKTTAIRWMRGVSIEVSGKRSEDPILAKIKERYSEKELALLAKGGLPMEYKHTPVHSFHGKVVRFGYLSDTHIGSVYTDYSYLEDANKEFKKADVHFIVHAGDVVEGVSNRPGHVYECTEYGYFDQKEKAIELLRKFDYCPLYMIDGNHDRWYIKNGGAIIVKDICAEIPNAEFLGHDEGDIVLSEKVTIKLWHGLDASSYAFSYRLQKLIESLQGGEKPNVLIAGHVHKYGHFFDRNIHVISAGCIQKQSKWMRGKRLPAHTGFGIIEMEINKKGVGRFQNTFFPFYA